MVSFNLLITTQVQSTEVRINKEAKNNTKEQLPVDILALILSKVEPQATLRHHQISLPQASLEEEIKSGNIDLMWAGAAPRLDSTFNAVRIPLFKGLLGHRVFIIKKGQQARFDNIKTLAELQKLQAGQGALWGDTQVLKSANIPVVTTLKYNNLFYMLEGESFDYFPRALHEPWSEVASRPELGLTVEKNIMLVYPYAMYFYVAKNNQALHDKLYKGFEMAIADGSFDKLFFSNEMIKDALTKSNFKNRTVINIGNPVMHPDTPLERKEFWLDINSI